MTKYMGSDPESPLHELPTEREVRRHAVIEGALAGATIGFIGTGWATREVSENIIGEETVALIENGSSASSDQVSTAEHLIYVSPLIITPLAIVGIYKAVSSMIRHKGGSPFIGYRNTSVPKKGLIN